MASSISYETALLISSFFILVILISGIHIKPVVFNSDLSNPKAIKASCTSFVLSADFLIDSSYSFAKSSSSILNRTVSGLRESFPLPVTLWGTGPLNQPFFFTLGFSSIKCRCQCNCVRDRLVLKSVHGLEAPYWLVTARVTWAQSGMRVTGRGAHHSCRDQGRCSSPRALSSPCPPARTICKGQLPRSRL